MRWRQSVSMIGRAMVWTIRARTSSTLSGLADETLDEIGLAGAVEKELRLGQRHEDDELVEIVEAGLVDRLDRIGLEARA